MIKLMVGWRNPQDAAAFDTHYDSVHAVLAAKLPGLLEFNVSRSHDPETAPFRVVAELTFASAEAMQTAMASDEGRAAAADGPNLRAEAVSWTADVHEVVARA